VALVLLMAACQSQTSAPPGTRLPAPASASAPTLSPAPGPTSSAAPELQQRDEPPLPAARQEVAEAALPDRLLVIGGFDAAYASRGETYVFDGQSWSTGPRLPIGLDHPSAAVLNGNLYVAGGYSGGPASARVFRLDGDRWTDVASMHHARGALALAAAGAHLYAMGGAAGADVAPAERYDPQANTWTDLPALARPRNHVSGFEYRGAACLAGGRSPNVSTVECTDGGPWSTLPDLPAATSGAGAGTLPNDIPVVAGGEDPGESRLVDQLAYFRAGAWTARPMLHPRHGIQLALFQDRLWACGGADQPGLHPVPTCTSIALR
jgi:hypothetical protein